MSLIFTKIHYLSETITHLEYFFFRVLLPYFHKSLKPFIHRGFSYGSNYGSKMVVSVYCHAVYPLSFIGVISVPLIFGNNKTGYLISS